MFDQAQQAAQATKGDVSPLAVMNNVKSELLRNLQGTIGGLQSVGLLEPVQARQTLAAISDQALRHNNTIAQGPAGRRADALRPHQLPGPARPGGPADPERRPRSGHRIGAVVCEEPDRPVSAGWAASSATTAARRLNWRTALRSGRWRCLRSGRHTPGLAWAGRSELAWTGC